MSPETRLTRSELRRILLPPEADVDEVLAMTPEARREELLTLGIDVDAARSRLDARLAAHRFGPVPVPPAAAETPAERLRRARERGARYRAKFEEIRQRLASAGADTGSWLAGHRLPDLQVAFNNLSAGLDDDASEDIRRDLMALAELGRELSAEGWSPGGPEREAADDETDGPSESR